MANVQGQKSSIVKTPANTQGKGRVDFRKDDFEALIQNKGHDVYHEKAIKCPCHVKNDGSPLSNCRNCGGCGWVFINLVSTRMVLSGMNIDTKFKEWSEEKLGTVKITARDCDSLSFMDRITVIDGETTTSQLLYPTMMDQALRARTIYNSKKIQEIFAWDGHDSPLKLLIEGSDNDYTVENDFLVFNNSFNDWENFSVSIRYTHSPQFNVIDLQRETMVTTVRDSQKGGDKDVLMPISAVARRTHYIFDKLDLEGTYLFDNSYDITCNPSFTNSTTCSPVIILRSDGQQLTIVNPGQEYQLEESSILQAVSGGPNQFIQFLHPGEDYIIPIILPVTITSDGNPVTTIPSGGVYDIVLHSVKKSDNSIIETVEFNIDTVVEDTEILRYVVGVGPEHVTDVLAEGSYIIPEILLHKQGDIFVTKITNLKTILIETDYDPSDVVEGVSDVTITVPGPIVASGIAYHIPIPSVDIQHVIGDPYWHLINGTHNNQGLIKPTHSPEIWYDAQQSDVRVTPATGTFATDSVAPTLLKINNAFGNKYRFTDDIGNPSDASVGTNIWAHVDWYRHSFSGATSGYVIDNYYGVGMMVFNITDHLTGRYRLGTAANNGQSWDKWIEYFHIHFSKGAYTAGNSGWRLPSLEEIQVLPYGEHNTDTSSTGWTNSFFKGIHWNGSVDKRFSLLTGSTPKTDPLSCMVFYTFGNSFSTTYERKLNETSWEARTTNVFPIRNDRR